MSLSRGEVIDFRKAVYRECRNCPLPGRPMRVVQPVRKRSFADTPSTYVQNIALQDFGRDLLTDITYGQDAAPVARTFAYVRVSTAGQTTENQIQEIKAAGFTVTPRRVVSETVLGSSAIEQRPGFMRARVHCLALGPRHAARPRSRLDGCSVCGAGSHMG